MQILRLAWEKNKASYLLEKQVYGVSEKCGALKLEEVKSYLLSSIILTLIENKRVDTGSWILPSSCFMKSSSVCVFLKAESH